MMKTQAHLSQLVMIDLQERLINAMPQEAMQYALKAAWILASGAGVLEIQTIITEQYPKGLGTTDATLKAAAPNAPVIEKTEFSACAVPAFKRLLTRDKPQIILAGLEAHICLLQTALDLLAEGKQVFVAEDAIISRNPANKANALARMREAGVVISNVESILLECLGKAEGDAFKTISKLIR